MSERGKWKLTVRAEFAASHSLRNYGGKCEALHGHNFGVELTVSGDRLAPDTDILVDFTVLKRDLKEVLDLLDHTHLNEVPPFDAVNPSSENLARFIYRTIRPRVEAAGARMESVTVAERAAQSATYWEE
ncbi:MAG: 6-carboxytetrahydropterin synthase QueD [Desulfovibrionaceae bacterium]